MFRKMTSHVRAHFVGYLALFVALGGTSYAAVSLPKNSVTSKQVKDGSLLKKDFKNGQLPRGARGPQGPRGLAGVVGQNGLNGLKGADGHVVLTRARGQGAKATSGVTDSDFPMNNATFTQGADQVALFQGQFSWEAQSACSTGYILLPPTLFVSVFADGKLLATGIGSAGTAGTADLSFLNSFLFEPGSATSRTLTVRISDSCADKDVTVDDVKINAIGLN